MNILIVGNGFDLSHYLPTKYDHFMDVMEAIESKKLEQPIKDLVNSPFENLGDLFIKFLQLKKTRNPKTYEMNFDELFRSCRDKKFIQKTKQIYVTDSINMSFDKIIELQFLLRNNSWYQYFKNHVKEIKTWIDFEQKIEEVLKSISSCIDDIALMNTNKELFKYFDLTRKDGAKIRENDFNVLEFFSFFKAEEYKKILPSTGLEDLNRKSIGSRNNINPKFCNGGEIKNGLNQAIYLSFLNDELESFIEIFNLYISLIIFKLEPRKQLKIKSKIFNLPKDIYSFNYTDTYQRFYITESHVSYLHGKFGEKQNIVLGVSELTSESLKKLKAFGFTKYHQKLFKETDYLFIDKYKIQIKEQEQRIRDFERPDKELQRKVFEIKKLLNLNFYIWGHSLDLSDEDYILDLFSLNDDIDRNVRVTVFYFDKLAKFSLLNNLLAILKKDKVEQWMKNKWLTFEPNPEIDFGIREEASLEKEAS
jgi:hypothetical protein